MFRNGNGNSKEVQELQIENQRLKVENETLQFKLDAMNERYEITVRALKEAKSMDANTIKEENKKLRDELDKLKFQMENNTSNIEVETENKTVKAELKVLQAENAHLRKLLDTYRAMPDVRNMIENLSTLAVPQMSELKEFAKIISDSKVTEMHKELSKVVGELHQISGELYYRRPRY